MTCLKEIDTSRPVQTVRGRHARIVYTLAKGDYPLVVLLEGEGEDYEFPIETDIYGRYSGSSVGHPYDIVNIPEEDCSTDINDVDDDNDGIVDIRIGIM